MSKSNTQDSIASFQQAMEICGAWPKEKPTFVYKLKGYLYFSAAILIVTVGLSSIIVDPLSFGRTCEILYVNIAISNGTLKNIVLIYNKSKFSLVIKSLQNPELKLYPSYLDIHMQKSINKSKRLFHIITYGIAAAVIPTCLAPIFVKNVDFILPFPNILKEYSTTLYLLLNALQACSLVPISWYYMYIDGTICTFIYIATTHFKILRQMIITSGDVESSEHVCTKPSLEETSDTYGKYDDLVNKRLEICIKYHNAIIDLVAVIEDTVSTLLLVQLVTSGLLICLTAVNLTITHGNALETFMMIGHFGVVTSQWALFSNYGNKIIVQSSEIVTACYFSNWTNCGQKPRKTLFIIMERSKRPVFLSAAKFVHLSLQSFTGVLRNAYTYFTVLFTRYNARN